MEVLSLFSTCLINYFWKARIYQCFGQTQKVAQLPNLPPGTCWEHGEPGRCTDFCSLGALGGLGLHPLLSAPANPGSKGLGIHPKFTLILPHEMGWGASQNLRELSHLWLPPAGSCALIPSWDWGLTGFLQQP